MASLCRLCGSPALHSVVDLGTAPPCERFLTVAQLDEPEPCYPLHPWVCQDCRLVQLPVVDPPEDTLHQHTTLDLRSATSPAHTEQFVTEAAERAGLGADSFVMEVASGDGRLLRHVLDRGVRCLGLEPAVEVATTAWRQGVPTVPALLDLDTADEIRAQHGPADLVVVNDVYSRVPDLVRFTRALRRLVADTGWVSVEVPHLLSLMHDCRFVAFRHERLQYFSVASAQRALARGGFTVVDVELLPSRGGWLRLWARPVEAAGIPTPRVGQVLVTERAAGLHEPAGYRLFARRVVRSRQDLLRFLLDAAAEGRCVVGYGALGQGSTLLNYCGIREDLLRYTVDRDPSKHGRFFPGTHVPIHPVERLHSDHPDYVLVLSGDRRDELVGQLACVAEWGGRLVFPIPHLEVVEPTDTTARSSVAG
ncbi:MAG TPA: class I SAM-dependent methyltransferase [Pseudonocardiaceae bacterium]